ncbi:MAG: hypothetical protein M3083_02390 [Actinomycetota bacterium]|nr:hypothetical protein [Actinomycetota bacterium]MDQ6949254.1 hypothetical protein [Actinomycetota bacterium]
MTATVEYLDYRGTAEISRDGREHGQDKPNRLQQGVIIAGLPVQVAVHHDASYRRQSIATADVWNRDTLTWNRAAWLLPEDIIGCREAADTLIARVTALLQHDGGID